MYLTNQYYLIFKTQIRYFELFFLYFFFCYKSQSFYANILFGYQKFPKGEKRGQRVSPQANGGSNWVKDRLLPGHVTWISSLEEESREVYIVLCSASVISAVEFLYMKYLEFLPTNKNFSRYHLCFVDLLNCLPWLRNRL